MTISVLQQAFGSTTGAGQSSASVTLSGVNAGSSIYLVGVTNSNNLGWNAPSDGANTYIAIGTITDTTGQHNIKHWYLDNVASGTHTITVSTAFGNNQLFVLAFEIGGTSGYDSSATIPSQGGAWQTAPGTGSNAISTGNFTPSTQPGLMCVVLYEIALVFTDISAGTGFTAGTNGNPNANGAAIGGGYGAENKRYTALTAFAGTFTMSAAPTQTLTVAALFKEAAAATQNLEPWQLLGGVGAILAQ